MRHPLHSVECQLLMGCQLGVRNTKLFVDTFFRKNILLQVKTLYFISYLILSVQVYGYLSCAIYSIFRLNMN